MDKKSNSTNAKPSIDKLIRTRYASGMPSKRSQRHGYKEDSIADPFSRKRGKVYNRLGMLDDFRDVVPPAVGNIEEAMDVEPDELPVIAGVIDERSETDKVMETFRANDKWKKVSLGHTSTAPFAMDYPGTGLSSDRVAKTLDGKLAGLQDSRSLRSEMRELKKREQHFFESLDESVSGRYAATRVRDHRTEEEKLKESQEEANARERKLQYDKWGKGLKQVGEQKDNLKSAMHEMSKPLARYRDDADLDSHLRGQKRDGDPMLEFLSKKTKTEESDKKKYLGPPPEPNRFGIPPGYRWDGVDRSNGYEKDFFAQKNSRKAMEEDAYKWRSEDM